jgi:hypothetical protein
LREPTKQFLAQCRSGVFVPYVSTVVLHEIRRADPADARRMLADVERLAPVELEPSSESEQLAEEYIRTGILPAKKRDDARHAAIATTAGIERLVSWNHRHLANERKRELFNAVNRLMGHEQTLLILTPFEVLR